MNNNNRNSSVPRLRFPEFNGEWVEKKFKDITFPAGEKNKKNLTYERYSISNEFGFYPQNEQFEGGGGYLKDIDCSRHIIVSPHSFAYNPARINVGSIGYQDLGKNVIVSPLYEVFQTTDDCDDVFLWQWFHSNIFRKMVMETQEGGVRQCFSYNKLCGCSIMIPALAEQQKIAAFLSELDDEIIAENQQVEAFKAHKKGLMQQLFPSMSNEQLAMGNCTPNLRFPGFEGEWDYVNGDVLFESISNKKHNSDLPILALTQDQGAVPRELINYKVQVSEKSVEGYKVVDIDDFIISLRSFQGGIEYSRYKGLCSPAYIVLRKKNKNVVSDFYRHYFKSFKYIQDLNKNLEGIRDGKMISFKQFSEIKIPFPSYPEQQKIADCLSALDEEIAAQEQKVEALKEHKKGLIQQLFPQPTK